MRPLGFESPTGRVERSLVVGFAVGLVAIVLATTLAVFTKRPTARHSAILEVATAFGLGFFVGFALAFTRHEYAPAQPKDDADAEASVLARLVPPLPTLTAGMAPESNKQNI
jgi:hypothetical protein